MPVILHLPLCLFIISMSGRLCKVYPVMMPETLVMISKRWKPDPVFLYFQTVMFLFPVNECLIHAGTLKSISATHIACRPSSPNDGVCSSHFSQSVPRSADHLPEIREVRNRCGLPSHYEASVPELFFFIITYSFRLYQKFHLKEKRRTTLNGHSSLLLSSCKRL